MKARFSWSLAVLAAVALAPLGRAWAQTDDLKPVAIVSLAGVNEITGDIGYLTEAAGVADLGNFAKLMIGGFTQGIDGKRPGGVMVTMGGAEPKAVGFIPISDFNVVKRQVEERVGEIEDAGGGVMRVALDQPVYLKEQGGWVFASDSAANLGTLPKDPAKLLDGLDSKYLVAARVFVSRIPAELRELAVTQLKAGFERGFDQGFDGSDEDRELAEKVGRNSIQQMVSLIEESETVTLGLEVDGQKKSTHLDFSLTARPNTKLARQMAMLADTKSDFAGFRLPNAAASAIISSRMAKEDIDQAKLMLKVVRDKAMSELDNDESLPAEARKVVKGMLSEMLDVTTKTIESGKMDMGAALVLEPKNLKLAVGGYVADGTVIDRSFRKLVELAQKEPDFPKVTFDADKHGNVTFHTMSVPVPGDDPQAQQILGEQLDIALGVGPKSVYMAMGKDSLAMVKSIIDTSAAKAGEVVSPFEVVASMKPILEFAESVEGDPVIGMMIDALKQSGGNDHIRISAESIDRGVNYRVAVEDGVLQMIGGVVRQFTQGGGGF